MIRIVNTNTAAKETELQPKAKTLLQVIGIIIADQPQTIQTLLKLNPLPDNSHSEEELAELLLNELASNNTGFNNALTAVIIKCSMDSVNTQEGLESKFNEQDGQKSGSIWGNIASTVDHISGVIGQGIKGKQAKDMATAQTLQGIYAYKSQKSAQEQQQTKRNTNLLIGLLCLAGLLVFGIVISINRNSSPTAST